MKNLKDLINSKKKGIKKTASCAYFCSKAQDLIEKLVGEKDFKVKKLQGKNLFVEVSNPSLAQKIKSKEEEILQKLNSQEGFTVDRISYKVALK